MTPPPSPTSVQEWALFLDLDGTLAELVEHYDDARVPATVVRDLERVFDLLGGAVAVVSGRPISAIDTLLAPGRFPAAGVHGAEWRGPDGVTHRVAVDHGLFAHARQVFGAFAVSHPGTLVEDKGLGLVLHFRRNPAAEDDAVAMGERMAREIGPPVAVLHGKMMVELRHHDATKGSAVTRFLNEPPFAGRRPVYVGDDVTDEDGFEAVNRRDGISVLVGAWRETAARFHLQSVDAVHRWLEGLVHRLGS